MCVRFVFLIILEINSTSLCENKLVNHAVILNKTVNLKRFYTLVKSKHLCRDSSIWSENYYVPSISNVISVKDD